jgi:hypothetical protein
MKRTIRIMTLVAALWLLALAPFAQDKPAAKEKPAAPDKPAAEGKGIPKIVFEKLIHDFGQMKPESEVLYDFNFKNEGDGILEIQNVRSSCGCTVVVPDKRSLAPGESSFLKVKYHAGRGAGMVDKKITVYNNDPKLPAVILTITASIATDLEFTPVYVRFDNIPSDKPADLTVYFNSKDPVKFQLTDIKSDQPYIATRLEKGEDNRFRLVVSFVPPQVKAAENRGYLNAMISAKSNSETYPEIKIPVYIKFQEDFTAVPVRLILYNVPTGEGAVREVILRNNKGEKFEISNVSSSNANVIAEIARNGDTANLIRVTIDKKTPAGLCNGVLTIAVGKKIVVVPVRARIGSTPEPPSAPPVRPPAEVKDK